MTKVIGIGKQSFEDIIQSNCFYIDKTSLIKEWWESEDDITLITRPRRFGKTLNMDMLKCFFSNQYRNQGQLFEGLNIWKEEKYQQLQGTYPVIYLSFADVKQTNYKDAVLKIKKIITDVYQQYIELAGWEGLTEVQVRQFQSVDPYMDDVTAQCALKDLSGYLYRYYEKKVIILLDEFDTPMQEAYIHGYWDEFTAFIRSLFNAAFKTNPYLNRAMMTGITRVSKESIFSDLNNLKVVTTTSEEYATCFGFTQEEVFQALEDKIEYRGILHVPWYHLKITNLETLGMFSEMFVGWFQNTRSNYNAFIKAMLCGNIKEMNAYMNEVALATFSSFDTGSHPSGRTQPERFYHGFVLGLLVELRDQYEVRSNRESGYGRYDVMLIPRQKNQLAFVLEFKVYDAQEELNLEDTVQSALVQIEEKHYDTELIEREISKSKIRHYGFAFEGKKVLIGE